VRGEQAFAECRRLRLVEPVEPGAAPRLLTALDDPRAAPRFERVGVHLEQPPFRRLEHERERRHRLRGAEPRELALAPVQVRAERRREAFAHLAVDAVGGDHEVVRRDHAIDVGDRLLEVHSHAEFARPFVQDLQQLHAREPAEAVAGAGHLRAPVERVDVGPVGEVLADAGEARRVRRFEVAECLVREHDALTEGVVGAVLLVDVDLDRRGALPQQDGEVQRRGAAADAGDLHAVADATRRPDDAPLRRSPGPRQRRVASRRNGNQTAAIRAPTVTR
jgi:hypothetical protein